MKPLEPGCKAVILNTTQPQNRYMRGKVVIVEKIFPKEQYFVEKGNLYFDPNDDNVLVSADFLYISNEHNDYFFKPEHLLRIDGDDFSHEGDQSIYKIKEKSV